MLKKRIIPCMDMRDGRVVKGVHFLDIRDAGDPVEAARQYGAHGADELMLLDINASHEGRKTMYEVVERVAEQVFIPFTVGGGIRIWRSSKTCCDVGPTRFPSIRRPSRRRI